MQEKQIPMQEWICMKCPHKSHVEVVSQFSTCMSLLRHGCQIYSFLKFPDRQSNVHFPWPNELTICPDIIGFQIPLKTSCTGHRWRKAKYVLFFCSRKICLVLFQGCRPFVLRHLCPVHKLNAQTPITTILKWMDWSYRKPYIYLSFNFWKQYPADGICLTAVNMQKYVTFLWLLFEYKAAKHRYIFLRGVGLEMEMK